MPCLKIYFELFLLTDCSTVKAKACTHDGTNPTVTTCFDKHSAYANNQNCVGEFNSQF